MVSERPAEIHRELVDPVRPRGWGSHRLHREDGPAVVWPDGWGVWSIHGVRVPRQVVESPETLTPTQITTEPNVEIRRVMLDRFGTDRYIHESGAAKIHSDDWGDLYRAELRDDEPLVMVRVVNSTPESDGSFSTYWLRVHPELRPIPSLGPPQAMTALNAVASTFDMTGEQYRALARQT
jgi:hypothetical protein